jgi:hypothetical protein
MTALSLVLFRRESRIDACLLCFANIRPVEQPDPVLDVFVAVAAIDQSGNMS